jgi:hypothetical protein
MTGMPVIMTGKLVQSMMGGQMLKFHWLEFFTGY